MSFSHSELIQRAERWLLKTKGCGFALRELSNCGRAGGFVEIPDVIGWKYGRSHLIECKTSWQDFLSDKSKKFRIYPEMGMGNFRYYFCLPGVINKQDLPDKWGLIYIYPKGARQIVKPEMFLNAAENEIPILCSALRRVHLKGDLKKIYDKDYRIV